MRLRSSLPAAMAVLTFGTSIPVFWAQTVLSDRGLALTLISEDLWRAIVRRIGVVEGRYADISLAAIAGSVATIAAVVWLGGGTLIAVAGRRRWSTSLHRWALGLTSCFSPLLFWLMLLIAGGPFVAALAIGTLPIWPALALAAGLTTLAVMASGGTLLRPTRALASGIVERRSVPAALWAGMLLYVLVFGGLTSLLWLALKVPHGDSAMYEEHLWNLLHGKGFRSYLDNGRLFLGEHVQVVHVLLVPLYLLWPSHLLLEYCQSLALAAGAVPVFRIAQRHSGSRTVGIAAALGYLLYVPMQYLDIAVDFKTFRPNGFEIPFLLFGLEAWERGRRGQFLIWAALTLSCQEDAAMVLGPLGVWMAFRRGTPTSDSGKSTQSKMPNRLFGLGLAAFSVLYLVLVVKVVLPWFRGGADVHFANYFSELGGSTDDIVRNLVRDPGRFAGRLCRPESLLFGLALILPLGGLPLLSPGRLAAAAPLFAILCLSDITNDPRHHFHAPLVPIVVWSALAGLGRVAPLWNALLLRGRRHGGEARDPFRKFLAFRLRANGKSLPSTVSVVRQSTPPAVRLAGTWLLFSSLAMGLFFGLSPLAIPFWDPGSPAAWREYVPDRRAQSFPAAFALVPRTARVASTDFVHPRFTHHERSYDYSSYRPVVPPDTEYIVIDTRHPYSTIRRPEQVKEYRDHPRDWELLMRGDFIVLRRRGVAVMP